jgi:hypothetical protein
LSFITELLEKKGPLEVEDKHAIAYNIHIILSLIHKIGSYYLSIGEHLTKQQNSKKTKIARSALPDLSERDNEILRLAREKRDAKAIVAQKC